MFPQPAQRASDNLPRKKRSDHDWESHEMPANAGDQTDTDNHRNGNMHGKEPAKRKPFLASPPESKREIQTYNCCGCFPDIVHGSPSPTTSQRALGAASNNVLGTAEIGIVSPILGTEKIWSGKRDFFSLADYRRLTRSRPPSLHLPQAALGSASNPASHPRQKKSGAGNGI